MITGYDLQYWFSNLWYDLTHWQTASLPVVGFKLVVIFFGFLFAKAILAGLWRVFYVETLRHILEPIFRIVLFPFRLPLLLWRYIKRKREQAQLEQYWQRQQQAEQLKAAAQDAERQRQEQQQIAELVRLQRAARID